MIDTGLTGRVAIVTGANHGIGAATAVALAREGAKVCLSFLRLSPLTYGGVEDAEAVAAVKPGRNFYYRQLTRNVDQVLKSIRDLGGIACALEADLADPSMITALQDFAETRLGPVEIVVNNAAWDQLDAFLPPEELEKSSLFAYEYPMRNISSDSHDAHFAVNSRAVALMIAGFAKRHVGRRATWGRIINISTDGAYAHPSNVSYGASKLAMESYSRAAAHELGPYGITVNVVSPGAVQTGWMTEDLERQLSAGYPLRRVGTPEDIARAVVFFASQQADWITGQVLHVGGGNRM